MPRDKALAPLIISISPRSRARKPAGRVKTVCSSCYAVTAGQTLHRLLPTRPTQPPPKTQLKITSTTRRFVFLIQQEVLGRVVQNCLFEGSVTSSRTQILALFARLPSHVVSFSGVQDGGSHSGSRLHRQWPEAEKGLAWSFPDVLLQTVPSLHVIKPGPRALAIPKHGQGREGTGMSIDSSRLTGVKIKT